MFPILVGTGARAEMCKAPGTAVSSGMLGVSVFGIFFTPVFYAVVERLRERGRPAVPVRSPTGEGTGQRPPE